MIIFAIYVIVAIGVAVFPIWGQKQEEYEHIDKWGKTGEYEGCRVSSEELKAKLRKHFWKKAYPEAWSMAVIFWPLWLVFFLIWLPFFLLYKAYKWLISKIHIGPYLKRFSIFRSLDNRIDNINCVKDIIK